MPMHYPPLSDGTYRYGDQPRPLPSPVPGPDPVPEPPVPFRVPSEGAQLPYVAPDAGPASDAGPAPEESGERSRPPGTVAAVAIIGGLALVMVMALGFVFLGPGAGDESGITGPRGPFPPAGPGQGSGPGAAALEVDGTFTVVSSPADPVAGDRDGCDMPPALADIREGTIITLYEADTAKVSTDRLAFDGGDLASCTFTFGFSEVTPGGSLYMIELPGRGQLTYTESELRAGVDITLGR